MARIPYVSRETMPDGRTDLYDRLVRERGVKGLDCQAVRALLVARAQIVSQITTLKNCVRGILKTFGRVLPKGLRSQFPGRVRARNSSAS